jgi:hypothetical protein
MARASMVAALALSTTLLGGQALAQDEPSMAVGLPPPPGAPPRGGPVGPPPPTTIRSPTMVGIGSALVVGGVGSIVTGSVLFWVNGRNIVDAALDAAVHGPDTAAIISGGILVLIGIPLIAIGASRVPVGPEPIAKGLSRLAPSVAMTRGGGALTWTF